MVSTASIGEKVYFYLSNTWYKGAMPVFYDSENWELTVHLKARFPELKKEILSYYKANADKMPANFTPYDYAEKGWKTINLYTYGLRYAKHCRLFPVLDEVVRDIPGMTMVQIAVLEPGVRVKAHLGDTNAIIRNHMGISIPGQLPDLGLRVGQQEVCWREGEMFSFCIVHRHYAWNSTNSYRIALIVDVIHPDYRSKMDAICAQSLALISMKFVATRLKVLKNLPRWVTRSLQLFLSVPFRIIIWFQRNFSSAG